MFLEDIKDAKENPGLNPLDFSVQQGYLNNTIVTEEIAFALIIMCALRLCKKPSQ